MTKKLKDLEYQVQQSSVKNSWSWSFDNNSDLGYPEEEQETKKPDLEDKF